MNKKILSMLVVAMLAIGYFSFAMAQEVDDSTKIELKNEQKRLEIKNKIEERKQKIEEVKKQRQAMVEERKVKMEQAKERICENVENMIRTRINRYENNNSRHQKVLGNMEQRLAKVIVFFEQKKLDVTELKLQADTLGLMIDDVLETHQIFIETLSDSENFVCGESEGEYKNKIGEARKVLPEVKTGIEDIRKYYKDTIRPEIISLRQQLEDDEDDQDEGDETEEESENQDQE